MIGGQLKSRLNMKYFTIFAPFRASSNRNGQKNRKIGICAPKK